MNLSYEKRCDFIKMLANLRCPGCFGVAVNVDERERCDCRVTINSNRIWGWE